MHVQAIQRYTMAASIAVQRPPWEAQQLMREELSMILSNRSAAFFEAGDFVSALVDAETVISLKRPWSKGHFRKARSLMKLERYQDAKDAIQLGLSFEPTNPVSPPHHKQAANQAGVLIRVHLACVPDTTSLSHTACTAECLLLCLSRKWYRCWRTSSRT